MKKFFFIVMLGILAFSGWNLFRYYNPKQSKEVELEKPIIASEEVRQDAEKFAIEFKNLVNRRSWYRINKMCQNPKNGDTKVSIQEMPQYNSNSWRVIKVANNKKTPNRYTFEIVNQDNQLAKMFCISENGKGWKFDSFEAYPIFVR